MSRGFASVLRLRNFTLLTASCSLSQLGDRLTHMLLITIIAVAQPGKLMAYSTGSLAFVIPTMLLAPIAGVLVDRWDKRKVIGLTHLIQSGLLVAAAFFMIALNSFVPFWIALAIFFGLDVFNNTAVPALMPQLVARRKLLTANSVNLTFCRVATVLGMTTGGFLIKWTGWKYGMFINASTHLTAGLLALAISGVFIAHSRLTADRSQPTASGQRESVWDLVAHAFRQLFIDLAEVVRVVGRSRLVGFVMASLMVTQFVSSVSYTILIYLVQQVLNLGTGGVGIFAGFLAVGMIAGAAGLSFIRKRINQPMVVVGAILLYGLMFLASPWLITIWFMIVIALVAGVAFSGLNVVQNTMLQEEVPDEIRGRIFSTREFLTNIAFLLTTLFIGGLGDLTSYKTVLVAIGAALTTVAVIGWVFVRAMQRPVRA
ncbi:MFS transporter [candidate division WOR-3 bacterium]|uniref:MFS transporter n=1 Tax=candidate division WOR-3 bacterium TaxID=2052148 RepID=A0A937XEH7_UNCW3|nr:MFS transporter [candidate division WOR-3 bacterium]